MTEAIGDYNFRQAMQIYPGAIQIHKDEQFQCCDSTMMVEFFWTTDQRPEVQRHYERFTFPFLENRTIYHPFGAALELGFTPYFPLPEDQDFLETRECHFSQKLTCVQVELQAFKCDERVYIPDLTITAMGADPLITTGQWGGTLITYIYFEEADFNFRFFD